MCLTHAEGPVRSGAETAIGSVDYADEIGGTDSGKDRFKWALLSCESRADCKMAPFKFRSGVRKFSNFRPWEWWRSQAQQSAG